MPEQKEPDVGAIIANLFRLAAEFNAQSPHEAKMLREAAEALRTERAQNRALQRKLKAILQPPQGKKPPQV